MKQVILLGLIAFISVYLSISFVGCSECQDDPIIRLQNNGTGPVDIQIKTADGDTMNINYVVPGSSMGRTAFEPGEIEFTVYVTAISDTVVDKFTAEICTNYVFEVHPDNSVTRRNFTRD